jgi:hypothetical protein
MNTNLSACAFVVFGVLTFIGCDQPAATPSKTEPATPSPTTSAAQPAQTPVAQPAAATPTQKAAAGVGEKGHGYGEGLVATPAATFFNVKERVAFDIQIPQAMQLFKATEGHAPKTHAEFMEKIIKANMIHLPQLPEGKKYRYDPKTEQLMVDG